MGRVLLPSEKGDVLNEAEGELLFSSFYRASTPVTILNGLITIPGSGRYAVEPESGITDELTGIVLSAENLDGVAVELRPGTAGTTITLIHSPTFGMIGGGNVDLITPKSTIWLRYYGAVLGWGVFVPPIYVP